MNIAVTDYRQLNEDYLRIEQAILYLEKNAQNQPELSEIASAVGLSEYHFQRLFTRWAGISPKRFLQFVTRENAKELLDRSENLLDTTLQVGLSSLGRLHDLFVTTEAVTPGEYKSRGEGLTIRYGLHATPFELGLRLAAGEPWRFRRRQPRHAVSHPCGAPRVAQNVPGHGAGLNSTGIFMRPSKRAADELRPVSLERNVARYAEGSCLVKFGQTHVVPRLRSKTNRPPGCAARGAAGSPPNTPNAAARDAHKDEARTHLWGSLAGMRSSA